MHSKSKKFSRLRAILIVVLFIASLSFLLYPVVSNWYNSSRHHREITVYRNDVASLSSEELDGVFEAAEEFNTRLAERKNLFKLSDDMKAEYDSMLSVGGSQVMGYLEIPSLEIELPIYHGSDETVLQRAVGHMEWSSLPVGGESSHCVISGHRGLPSSKLLTEIDKLIEGDVFVLNVLDRKFTYEVDQILIVEPKDISALGTIKGEDYCTLVTCTPYGINTHRLLVRGHRIENIDEATGGRLTADGVEVAQIPVSLIIVTPFLIVLIILLALYYRNRYRKK